ncbi:DUF4224 domain-containing protein [Pseudomonas putida]|uniref:DUF4224 domain-containing protein n=2 Tax=Pseudomonas TaxID=286 RepID=A0A7Y6DFW8_9PSED|nr:MULTISPECIES: hypothetical protein [Pseudomonadaceae]KJC17462.1 prophage PSSB64-01 [Pseudomonas aeruginosa]MDH1590501.1 hypothetical protein [Stutzerimonas stutzeri]NUT85932.1 hypothetical protein [Pseudomonas corrugata]PKF70900.1 hypothetical protein CW360_10280 [Pseudomonas pharmacofabricae]QQZ36072.1 hypothetical protein IF103_23260 [Pseudomonas sp. SK2]
MIGSPAGVLTFDDLKRITGYARRADVERTLHEQGIRLFRGRTGPWTTVELINQAGGLKAGNQEQYGVEIL